MPKPLNKHCPPAPSHSPLAAAGSKRQTSAISALLAFFALLVGTFFASPAAFFASPAVAAPTAATAAPTAAAASVATVPVKLAKKDAFVFAPATPLKNAKGKFLANTVITGEGGTFTVTLDGAGTSAGTSTDTSAGDVAGGTSTDAAAGDITGDASAGALHYFLHNARTKTVVAELTNTTARTATFEVPAINKGDKFYAVVETVAQTIPTGKSPAKPLHSVKTKTITPKLYTPPAVPVLKTKTAKLTPQKGKSFSLAIKATGSATLSYVWTRPDGSVVKDKKDKIINKSTITLKPATKNETVAGGIYTVEVGNFASNAAPAYAQKLYIVTGNVAAAGTDDDNTGDDEISLPAQVIKTGTFTGIAGTTISITAAPAPSGFHFSHWTSAPAGNTAGSTTAGTAAGTTTAGDIFDDASAASTSFVLPATATTITANYAVNTAGDTDNSGTGSDTTGTGGTTGTGTDSTTGGTTGGTDNSGTGTGGGTTGGTGNNTTGDTDNSTADAGDDSSDSDTAAPLPPTYALTIAAGTLTATTTGDISDTEFTAGTIISISADAAPDGFHFSHWTAIATGTDADTAADTAAGSGTGGIFAAATSADTIFIMPATATTITAHYAADPAPPTPPPAPETYTLTVENGTVNGGTTGEFTAGSIVAIIADPAPDGFHFSHWTATAGGTFGSETSAKTIFVMPAAATTITAVYADDPAPPPAPATYTLTVENGTVNGGTTGEFTAGSIVAIIADPAPDGFHFSHWTATAGGTFGSAISAETIFVMPAAATTITAVYADDPAPPPAPATYTLTVQNGIVVYSSGTGADTDDYLAGELVFISADPANDGAHFVRWEITAEDDGTDVSGTLSSATSPDVIFKMPAGSVTITAVYEDDPEPPPAPEPPATYELTVSAGTIIGVTGDVAGTVSDDVNGKTTGEFTAGSIISIAADAPQAGEHFSHWEITAGGDAGGTFGYAAADETIFIMPAGSVTITAVYAEDPPEPQPPATYTLTIENGTVVYSSTAGTGGAGDNKYLDGEYIFLTANNAPANKHFSHWTTSAGGTFGSAISAETIFVMPANATTITAVYADDPAPPPATYTLTVQNGTIYTATGGTITTGTFAAGELVVVQANPAPELKYFSHWSSAGGGVFVSETSAITIFVMPASNVTITANIEQYAYLVIDLSAGPTAETYPVTTMKAVPEGGWSDEYKTTKLVLRYIPPGTFTMGSPIDETGRGEGGSLDETQIQVKLTKGFYIGIFEVTQGQYELVNGDNPSKFKHGENHVKRPVECLPYNYLVGNNDFPALVRAKSGFYVTLPTCAQWEYACRAGTTTALNSGKNLTAAETCPNLAELARYKGNSNNTGSSSDYADETGTVGTAFVGSYLPNNWGLYDMHGNVMEFCADTWLGNRSAVTGLIVDPFWGDKNYGSLLGGRYNVKAGLCRSASAMNSGPWLTSPAGGFRVIIQLP